MYYGEVIRYKRKMQSISTHMLANILDIDRSVLCRYETGKRNVSKNHAKIIENYINGNYDQQIFELLMNELEQKYVHLLGKKGLQLWEKNIS